MSILTKERQYSHISLGQGDGVHPPDCETTHAQCMSPVGLKASETVRCEGNEKQETGEPHGVPFHPEELLNPENHVHETCDFGAYDQEPTPRNMHVELLSSKSVDELSVRASETAPQAVHDTADIVISASELPDAVEEQREGAIGVHGEGVARPPDSRAFHHDLLPSTLQSLDVFEESHPLENTDRMFANMDSKVCGSEVIRVLVVHYSALGIVFSPSWCRDVADRLDDLMTISLQCREDTIRRGSPSKALSQSLKAHLQVSQTYDQTYDLYNGAGKSSSGSLPLVLRVYALLALHRFLEEEHAGPTIDPSIRRSCFATNIIEMMPSAVRPISMEDMTFLYCVATDCIVQSPLFEGHSWMASESLVTHFGIVMEMRRFAIAYSRETYQSHLESEITSMTFFERLADILFPVPPVDIPWLNLPSPNQTVDNTFVSRIRKEIFCCWTTSLQSDVVAAYVAFHDTHLLEEPQYDSQDFMDLAVAFIDGLSRFCSRHSGVIAFIKGLLWPGSPEEFDWISCVRHLHLPDCLLSACQILSRRGQDVTQLARMDPDNMAWESCRERLREDCDGWCSEAREASRSQLDAFFVKYQRERHRLLTRISGRVMDWWCGIDTPSDMV